MKKIFLILLILPLLFSFLNCGNTLEEETKEEADPKSKEFVEITEAQMKAVDIKLGRFEKRNLKTTVKANGVLEIPPQNKANVSAMLGGTVKSINVIEGNFVKEGAILALLEHPQFIELQQEYLETLNSLQFIKQDYERKKKLYDENISSGKEYQKTESEFKTMNSKLKSLKAKIEMIGLNPGEIEEGKISNTIPIKAPIHGYVRKIEINIGAFAEPQMDMFEIVDNHHIHIDLLVYENDINKVKKGQKVRFKVPNLADKELQAKIFAVGKAFEEDLKAVRIHAEIENPDNELIPGMYVDGRIIVDNYEVSSLPETALIREGESSFIFIKTEEEHNEKEEDSNGEEHLRFKKISVRTGASDNGFTEVIPLEEIPENSQVVIYGAYYLESEMSKGEAEHHH
ncbi:MAG: efflux RND transporter periplasmic adaptor subunit [Ignavibacteriales bacterium]|nr:MAG: efflux RND transporter periplasmic adaptor subunit [Ignavibacteriales bacterium]